MVSWFPFSASRDEYVYQRERVHWQRIPSINENEMKGLFLLTLRPWSLIAIADGPVIHLSHSSNSVRV